MKTHSSSCFRSRAGEKCYGNPPYLQTPVHPVRLAGTLDLSEESGLHRISHADRTPGSLQYRMPSFKQSCRHVKKRQSQRHGPEHMMAMYPLAIEPHIHSGADAVDESLPDEHQLLAPHLLNHVPTAGRNGSGGQVHVYRQVSHQHRCRRSDPHGSVAMVHSTAGEPQLSIDRPSVSPHTPKTVAPLLHPCPTSAQAGMLRRLSRSAAITPMPRGGRWLRRFTLQTGIGSSDTLSSCITGVPATGVLADEKEVAGEAMWTRLSEEA